MLVAMASRAVQHRQKALEQMNRKLTEVVSAMNGKTGRAILRAILAGERDPQRLARHRDPRCTHDQATIAKAFEGHWRAEHLFALRQALEQYEFLQQQLQAWAQQIEACLQTCVTHVEGELPQTTPARTRRVRQRQAPSFDVHTYLAAMTGVDLTQIDGIDA
jgi:transposase